VRGCIIGLSNINRRNFSELFLISAGRSVVAVLKIRLRCLKRGFAAVG
jgi:hypothetical protein